MKRYRYKDVYRYESGQAKMLGCCSARDRRRRHDDTAWSTRTARMRSAVAALCCPRHDVPGAHDAPRGSSSFSQFALTIIYILCICI